MIEKYYFLQQGKFVGSGDIVTCTATHVTPHDATPHVAPHELSPQQRSSRGLPARQREKKKDK